MQPSMWRTSAVVLAFCGVLGCGVAQAENYVWQSNGTNVDWFTPTNWLPNGVPGPGDTADISQSGARSPELNTSVSVQAITLGQEFNARTITIGASTTLTCTTNLTLARGEILGTGTLMIPTGATLDNNDP